MWDKVKGWWQSPYTANMDAFHWFLFLGLLILIMAAWRNILSQMRAVE